MREEEAVNKENLEAGSFKWGRAEGQPMGASCRSIFSPVRHPGAKAAQSRWQYVWDRETVR